MDKFPVTLEKVFFTKTIVVALPDHKRKDGVSRHQPENSISVDSVPDEKGVYVASMQTRFNPDRDPVDPYFIEMECIGFFKSDVSLSDDEAKDGITLMAHSVLYGAIRESVAWITGRHPHGPLLLGLSILKPNKKPKEAL